MLWVDLCVCTCFSVQGSWWCISLDISSRPQVRGQLCSPWSPQWTCSASAPSWLSLRLGEWTLTPVRCATISTSKLSVGRDPKDDSTSGKEQPEEHWETSPWMRWHMDKSWVWHLENLKWLFAWMRNYCNSLWKAQSRAYTLLLENPPKLERLILEKHSCIRWCAGTSGWRLQEKRNVYTTSRSQLVQCMLGKHWLGYYLPLSFAPECVTEN